MNDRTTAPASARFTEAITWRHVETDPPDADVNVLMSFPSDAEQPVETGWIDEDGWHFCWSGGNTPVPPIYWADMPEGHPRAAASPHPAGPSGI